MYPFFLMTDIKKKESNLKALKSKIKENGIPENLSIEINFLTNWLGSYAEICTIERNKLDWLPWSRRSKLIRPMKKNEKVFREMDENGYSHLFWI